MKLSLLISVLLLLLGLVSADDRYTSSLTKWKFSLGNSSFQYPANIPSSLSLDLVDNGHINKPYYRDNFLTFYNF